MQVRPAALADLTALRLLWSALCREGNFAYPDIQPDDRTRWTADMAQTLERQMAGDPTTCTLIALDDAGTPLGFLTGWLQERRIGSPHRFWVVDHLYVVPAARGRLPGVGPQLILSALDYVAPLQIDVLELHAMAGDDQWARHGWTPVMTRYASTVARVRRRLERGKKSKEVAA